MNKPGIISKSKNWSQIKKTLFNDFGYYLNNGLNDIRVFFSDIYMYALGDAIKLYKEHNNNILIFILNLGLSLLSSPMAFLWFSALAIRGIYTHLLVRPLIYSLSMVMPASITNFIYDLHVSEDKGKVSQKFINNYFDENNKLHKFAIFSLGIISYLFKTLVSTQYQNEIYMSKGILESISSAANSNAMNNLKDKYFDEMKDAANYFYKNKFFYNIEDLQTLGYLEPYKEVNTDSISSLNLSSQEKYKDRYVKEGFFLLMKDDQKSMLKKFEKTSKGKKCQNLIKDVAPLLNKI